MKDFVKSVRWRSPAPGGGSVSALVGAMGSGLAAMVGKFTYGKKQWEHLVGKFMSLIKVHVNFWNT